MSSCRFVAAVAAACLLLGAPAADATIVSGPMMIPAPAELGPDPLGQGDFFAFYEQQDTVLGKDVKVRGGVVQAGTKVSSHYVLYDPSEITRNSVTITFDSKIVGVITSNRQLKKSDWLGAEGVDYKHFRYRGRERRDKYTISDDGYSITFHMRANTPGDYVRVLTEGSNPPPPPATPEPGAALLFGLGTALVGAATGRRRRGTPGGLRVPRSPGAR